MTIFKCRTVKPKISEWREVEAESFDLAANEFQTKWCDPLSGFTTLRLKVEDKKNGRYIVHFVLVEVEGHGEMVSRIFEHSIWRRGGVKGPKVSLKTRLTELAEKLGWTHEPEELIAEGWEGEEPDSV